MSWGARILAAFRRQPQAARRYRGGVIVRHSGPRVSADLPWHPSLRGADSFQAGVTQRTATGWPTLPLAIDSLIYNYLPQMRARSREAARNNPYIKRFLGLLADNVIGADGIKLQVQARDPNGKLDELANTAIETAWHDWLSDPDACDVRGQLDGMQLQRQALKTWARDGEALIQIVRGAKESPYAFQLLALDPEQLVSTMNVERLPNGGYVRMGIEFSAIGRPVAYHIRDLSKNLHSFLGGYQYQPSDVSVRRIERSDLIHCYLIDEPGQSRGIPFAHASMYRLNQLHHYEDAALVNARIGAEADRFISSPDGRVPIKDAEGADGIPELELEKGTYPILPEGATAQSWDSRYPDTAFEPFKKAMLLGIATGLEAGYAPLSGDLTSATWSSLRAAEYDERDVYMALQAITAAQLHRRIYNDWLYWQLVRGTITVAGKPLPIEKLAKFRAHRWQGRRWDWVDPAKGVAAARDLIDGRIKSTSATIRESTGREPDEVFAEIKAERELMAAMGITPEPRKAAPAQPAVPDNDNAKEADA